MADDITRRALLAGAGALAATTVMGVRTAAAATTPALFIAAHPDDETLAMGVAIAEHVAAGVPTHLLLLTRGIGSRAQGYINGVSTSSWWGVRHNPAAEGYAPLSDSEFGQARVRETQNAVKCLSSGLGTVTIHEAGLRGFDQAAAADAILTVANGINAGGPVSLKGHTWLVDTHSDHLAAGKAIASLAAREPARFASPRYYILAPFWSDSRLSQVNERWDYPANAGIRARAVNACRAHAAWAPPHSYAIGHHSSSNYFTPVIANPRCLYHA